MRKYYVLWTYVANYSKLITVEAENPAEAHKQAVGWYGKEFHDKATVYVFDQPPVATVTNAER